MSIEVPCSNSDCGKLLEVDVAKAGTLITCPHCQSPVNVPPNETNIPDSSEPGATVIPEDNGNGKDATIIGAVPAASHEQATVVYTSPSMVDGDATVIPQNESQSRSVVAVSEGADGLDELNQYLKGKRGRLPPFQTEKALAEGGMGAVLVCQDQALGRRVAVKIIKPQIATSVEHRARFLGEAQITGQLEHPNIVPIHDLGTNANGDLYFSMKLVKGHSLGEIVKEMKAGEGESRSQTELLNIFLKVCDGIAFAHAKGVVHRDLKPDNVMVGDFGEVLVMDWGLAKLIGRNVESAESDGNDTWSKSTDDNGGIGTDSVSATAGLAQTVAGTIQGTPAYMPPEQARGDIERIDHRADIYSLGAILYELLTLEKPIDGQSITAVVQNACAGKVIPPDERTPERNIPKELTAIVMKAMTAEREDRYQTVQELSRDITLYLEGRTVSAKEDTVLEALVKLIRRNKALSSAIGIAAAIILVLGTVSYVRIAAALNRAIKGETRAIAGEKAAQENEQKAIAAKQEATEAKDVAVAAQKKQRETALAASKRFALQAVEQANLNKLEPAKRRADDAALVAPESPWADFAKGAIAMAQVDYAKAIELFRKAAASPDGDQPEIQAALAEALSHQGELKDAETLLANMDNIDDWRLLLGVGRTLYAAQKWDACQKPLTRALELMNMEKDRPQENVIETERLLAAAPAQKACEGFYDEIRHLPVPQQAQRLKEKFVEIHGEDHYFTFFEHAEFGLVFDAENSRLAHLYPLRGLPIRQMKLSPETWDISMLKGMPLHTLSLHRCSKIEDLTPISETKTLLNLRISTTGVSDLTPIQNLELQELNCAAKEIADLSPLAGMPLVSLDMDIAYRVADITPLRGMPLEFLNLRFTKVTDLSPLRGTPLKKLTLPVGASDLSPLTGMPLTSLEHEGTPDSLEPLKELPLETLKFNVKQGLDLSPLSGLPLKFVSIEVATSVDLSPLQGLPLEYLSLRDAGLIFHKDLEFLRDSPVKSLIIYDFYVEDFSALATLENIDAVECPWVPYLAGKTTDEEFEQQLRTAAKEPGGNLIIKNEADVPHWVNRFKAQKLYGEGRLAEAISVFETMREDPDASSATKGWAGSRIAKFKMILKNRAKQEQN